MTDYSLLSNVATLSLFLGTLPSIVAIAKNRNAICGFSFVGSIGILAGQLLFVIYFSLVGDWITVILLLPVGVFWGIILVLKISKRGMTNA